MATHFLLTAKARSISLREVYCLGEDKAWGLFQADALAGDGRRAGLPEVRSHGDLRDHDAPQAQVQGVRSSVLGNVGNDLRQPQDVLHAIFSPLSSSWSTARRASRRFNSLAISIASTRRHSSLHTRSARRWLPRSKARNSGTVEVDGAYFGGYIRPANQGRRSHRSSPCKAPNRQAPCRRRGSPAQGPHDDTVTKSEAEALRFVAKVVAPESIVHADEATHWDALHAVQGVPHQSPWRTRLTALARTKRRAF